ncbi:hypothetical protein ACP_1553 [Acidobacterium capsulatum ATCC 51196]|uniref:Uncharacterized protein n=1 Tax=Acidobacterium capsulatum (strain ATCC 51196 / DSM 11244 / BCRC 80197 / JCM 7670 / NBRC 15755 / NCIMB 13165 / 161) TaxID=240015 RepID=C1F6P6_ACIC5|nr:hypothetical protein ACP_1553 [Acidobacterium capsulatum ATCC 51196]
MVFAPIILSGVFPVYWHSASRHSPVDAADFSAAQA